VFNDVMQTLSPLITAGLSAVNVFFFYKQYKLQVQNARDQREFNIRQLESIEKQNEINRQIAAGAGAATSTTTTPAR
jgi:hypothetical protein